MPPVKKSVKTGFSYILVFRFISLYKAFLKIRATFGQQRQQKRNHKEYYKKCNGNLNFA